MLVVSGRTERDLEDGEIPCNFENGDEGDGHDRTASSSPPLPLNIAKEQKDYLNRLFNGTGAVPWQDGKAGPVSTQQQGIVLFRSTHIYQPFSELPISQG